MKIDQTIVISVIAWLWIFHVVMAIVNIIIDRTGYGKKIIKQYIIKMYWERCIWYEDKCTVCTVWKFYDEFIDIE